MKTDSPTLPERAPQPVRPPPPPVPMRLPTPADRQGYEPFSYTERS